MVRSPGSPKLRFANRNAGREVKRLNSEIKKYQGCVNKELTDLSEKKKYAANNFAGATWEQSISFEMSAVTSKYDALIDSAEAKIN